MIRRKKHIIFQLANGRKITMSKSASDPRSIYNMISDLHKAGLK